MTRLKEKGIITNLSREKRNLFIDELRPLTKKPGTEIAEDRLKPSEIMHCMWPKSHTRFTHSESVHSMKAFPTRKARRALKASWSQKPYNLRNFARPESLTSSCVHSIIGVNQVSPNSFLKWYQFITFCYKLAPIYRTLLSLPVVPKREGLTGIEAEAKKEEDMQDR